MLAALRDELADVPGAIEAIDDLERVFDYLAQLGVPAAAYSLDLALARGLDYYTGPVFEATVEQPKIGSVGGAGRYDGLVGTFLGRPVPATGMSLGLERIIEVVQEFCAAAGQGNRRRRLRGGLPGDAGQRGRDRPRPARRRIPGGPDAPAQPRDRGPAQYAGRKGVPVAVIAGESELAAGTVAVKDLISGEQRTVPLIELPGAVRGLLGENPA